MSALSVTHPYPIFTDSDGTPLDNGYIWIGMVNLDPQGYPINVYWDAALTQLAGQPIRTMNGYPVRNGSPARLYVNSDYSIRVQNKNAATLYNAPVGSDAVGDISSALVTFVQAGTGAVSRTVQSKLREIVSRADFGSDAEYNTAKVGKFALNASFGAEIPADSSINGFDIGNGPNTGSASSIAQNQRFGKSSMLVNTTGYSLTAIGYETLSSNTVGYNLTALGRSALRFNLDGINNTAVGVVSLENNTSGSGNTAIGVSSSVSNTTGSNNTSLGFKAGFTNSTASGNTAVGTIALQYNTAANNTAVGYEALTNSTGINNTAVGMDAGVNVTSGANNVAVGKSALFASGTGNQNTAVGSAAIQGIANFSNTTGIGYNALNVSTANGNTAIGASAGSVNTSGSNNLFVGYLAGTDAVDTVTTNSNRIVMGNNSHTIASIKVAWTVTSDARDKTDFSPVPHGLSFVNALQPTAFRFLESRESSQASGPLRYGFKAQDILELEGSSPVIINTDDPLNLKYNESSLIPVLVKAIQELTARVAALEAT